MESQILKGLNQAQREAVVNYDSPSLIIAGAGSGKTRVLTSRIAYMIEQGVAPYNILALTFTNKAAEQMRERIAQMLPDGRHRYIRMGTFHSVFSRILRDNADRIGFPQSFTIYEPSDCKNLLKTIVRELNLDDTKYKPAMLASRISYAKNCLVTPGAYLANASFGAEDRRMQIPEFGNIYNIYCARCKRNGAMDFDDLLLQTNILLRDCPDVTARYQEQFKYILVDEYQDTNYAQYVIIRRLSQLHSKVCVVGDDAQSIYSFRGAKIENILSFKKDFPDAMIFKLEQNYRSTRTIVEAANSVIERNSKRMEKKCFSEGDMGEKIRVLRAYTDREEAEMVVSDLRDKVRAAGDEWAEAAILYRTNNQSQALEDALRRKGIPYRIYKGNSFYDHKEIKDLLAYIRLVINPRDDEAFKRIVNYPARGIGDTTVERIALLAKARNLSMWEAVDALTAEPVTDPVQKTIVRKVAEFVALVRGLSLARAEKGLYDLGLEIATRSGIIGAYRAENTPEATSALDNIEELLNSMQLFNEQREAEIRAGERQQEERATIEEWLQGVMLMTDMDKDDPQDRNKVTLMTVHSAKGLEYKFVYIVGLEENLFPSQRAVESPDVGYALLCRDAFQVGQYGVLASELLSARDRQPLPGNGCDAGGAGTRPPLGRAGRGLLGARRAAPPFRLPLPAEACGGWFAGRGAFRRRFVRRGKIGGAASRCCPADPFDGRDAQRGCPSGRVVAGRGSCARIVRRLCGRRPGVAPEVRRGGHPPHRNPGVGSQAGGRIFRIRGENPAGQIRQTDQIIGNPPEGFRLKTERQ